MESVKVALWHAKRNKTGLRPAPTLIAEIPVETKNQCNQPSSLPPLIKAQSEKYEYKFSFNEC